MRSAGLPPAFCVLAKAPALEASPEGGKEDGDEGDAEGGDIGGFSSGMVFFFRLAPA